MEQDNQTQKAEVVSSEALAAIERAGIDVQIETAKRFPRSIKRFLDTAKSMIAMDREIAEDCNYLLKRKDKDGGIKLIEGPSIRLLEIAATSYQNIRYGSRILGEDATSLTCQGVAHDLENNVAVSVEVRRRITTKTGMRYGDDMVSVTAMAGGAIARRNALNGVVPRSYINQLANYAKEIAKGDIKSLPERRQKAFDYYAKVLGIDQFRVLKFLDRESLEDVNLDDLVKLTSLKTALKDHDTTIEEAFPTVVKPPSKPIFDAPKAAGKEDDIPYNNIGTNTDAAPTPAPAPKPQAPQAGKKSNQDQLEDWWLGEVGSTFDEFRDIVTGLGEEDASSWTCFQDMHGQTARKYLNAKAGLLAERKNRMAGEGSAR